jgi:hypothetical protein
MDTLTSLVAGAAQFAIAWDLTALLGGLSATALDQTYLIRNVGYENDGAAHDFHCWLAPQGGAATTRLDIINVTGETGFEKMGCRIPIPRQTTSPFVWLVNFTTVGKAAAGTFILSVTKGTVEPT